MVPELASSAAPELADLREAVFAAAASLPPRWIAVGVGPADAVVAPAQAGTFAGYGVDLRVALSPGAGDAPGELPLCALITGWVRGRVDAAGARRGAGVLRRPRRRRGAGSRPAAARRDRRGRRSRRRAGRRRRRAHPHPAGARRLRPRLDRGAGGARRRAGRRRRRGAGPAARRRSSAASPIRCWPGWPAAPRSAKELYRGAPYGVGYFAGVWYP